jgi:cell division protein FtsW
MTTLRPVRPRTDRRPGGTRPTHPDAPAPAAGAPGGRAAPPDGPDATGETDEPGRVARAGLAVRVRVARLFESEPASFYLLLGTTLFLLLFGLVMVLSSSSIEQFTESGSFFSTFNRQAVFALLGTVGMLFASRLRAAQLRRIANIGIGVALLLQGLTLAVGFGGYNRNWLSLGGITFQPSEFVKLALAVWLGVAVTRHDDMLDDWRKLRRIAPVAVVANLLVLASNDLGTGLITLGITIGALWFAGVRLRYLAVVVAAIAGVVGFVAAIGASRSERIQQFLSGCSEADYQGTCWQFVQGTYALAAGGPFGVGLGHSQAKWNWLPASDNDFIYAIIGEELGMLGAVVVLGLFVMLAVAFVRIIRRSRDRFARATVGAIAVWIVGQAFLNIGVVLGVVPVLGVPLPLVSAGGTSLVAILLGIGVALSFARERSAPDGSAPAGSAPVRSVRS